MGMISEDEAHSKSICAFCEQPVGYLDPIASNRYRTTALCPKCYTDADIMAIAETGIGDQLDFELSNESPIPIISNGALNISWLMMHHPKCLIGSHITVEDYGLTAKFTIIPPTKEAGERIINTMREDRDNRNQKLGRSGTSHAPTRYQL